METISLSHPTTEPAAVIWSTAHKIMFRFAFILLILFVLVFSNVVMPILYPLSYPISLGLHALTPWLGQHVLHLPEPITVFTNGSGDTTYDFVNLLLVFVLAVAGCIIWSAAAKRETAGYPKMYYWLTVVVRYYVGLTLITYAMVKLFQMQFPHPGYTRLMQTYGESTPMGLAWTFYGFSRGYNFVIGLAELAGATLLFRRTVTFGAIISLFTSLNIMAVNYFFDVPVKMISTALVAMSLFLLSPNLVNLYNFFFKDEATKLFVVKLPAFNKKWLRVTRIALKALVICYMGVVMFNIGSNYFRMQKAYNTLAGGYKIDVYTVAGHTLPPQANDDRRWKNIAFERNGYAGIKLMNGKLKYYSVKQIAGKKMLILKPADGSSGTDTLDYQQPANGLLILNGKFEGNPIDVSLSKLNFELDDRGFHWINEYPNNK